MNKPDQRLDVVLEDPKADPEIVHLYQKAEKIYPREIDGRFQSLRKIAAWVLLGLYYVLPWLQWDERQMVLFDLPARKFYVFGFVFWPQDFILQTGLLEIFSADTQKMNAGANVSMAPAFIFWLSALKISRSPFCRMTEMPNVTSSGGRISSPMVWLRMPRCRT